MIVTKFVAQSNVELYSNNKDMEMINHILKYLGIYGLTIPDAIFFGAVLFIVIVLIKLYNRRHT